MKTSLYDDYDVLVARTTDSGKVPKWGKVHWQHRTYSVDTKLAFVYQREPDADAIMMFSCNGTRRYFVKSDPTPQHGFVEAIPDGV